MNVSHLFHLKNMMVRELWDYPDDLKIHINAGNIITTYNRPYMLWLNQSDKKTLIGVVDQDSNPEKISEYNSLFLLTNQYFVINRNKIPMVIDRISLAGVNTVIDKAWITNLTNSFNQSFPLFLLVFSILALVVVPLVAVVLDLIVLFIASILSFILFKYFKRRHTLKKTFQLSLHAATLPLILINALSIFNPAARNLHLPFLLLFMFFSLCALYEAYLDHAPRKHLRRAYV